MLHDFQQRLRAEIYSAWQQPNVHNVTPVSPTGSGKTVIVGSIITDQGCATAAIAHRQELVAQMSLALNREGVYHGIIAPKEVQHQIIALHHETHGQSYFSYRADVRVAGVDTLPNHAGKDKWFDAVRLVVQDEGHHVLRENKWGAAMGMFPNARGLYPTAHACRADGKGLGRVSDGLSDAIVLGPNCRELINRGFLTDYRLMCPSSDIDFSAVKIGSTGDYSMPQLRTVTHSSNRIVGDVVKCYLKYAAGKLGVTFAVDVEAAKEIAAAYNAADIPAEVITAKTSISTRGALMRAFRNKVLLQLVSVDCLGEGTDVPAIEVVSMVRKTASFQLYAQQFGRALRVMVPDAQFKNWSVYSDAERVACIAASAKPKAIIIDHVGNCMYHGLPDMPRDYTLLRTTGSRSAQSDAIPLRVCVECTQPYERILLACPWCGHSPVPMGRATPEQVDGDIIELDPMVLAKLRGEIERVDAEPEIYGGIVGASIRKNHLARQDAQAFLRRAMALWGGWRHHVGEDDRTAQKRFYHQFGIDVMSAQALGATVALELKARIDGELVKYNITEAL